MRFVVDKRWLAIAAMGLCAPALHSQTQGSDRSALAVVIQPEARVEPQQVPLQFEVSADGVSDVVSQTASVAAWVRSRPNQPIGVRMRLVRLEGPGGPLPPATLRWTAAAPRSTGGGREASCSAGDFTAGAVQELVTGWQKSGMLECAVTWQLTGTAKLPPGRYTGVVEFIAPR
jgi:hypothetical protein